MAGRVLRPTPSVGVPASARDEFLNATRSTTRGGTTMTTTAVIAPADPDPGTRNRPRTDATAVSVSRRLRPLKVAAFVSALVLWIPVEKLFLSDLGFTAASIGLMAAVYATVVPLLEFPSGVMADRWSRRGVLAVSYFALGAASLVGGLSHDVGTYLVSAALLGVALAMQSGTADAMVYDVLVEEAGSGDGFTRQIGRVRLLESLGHTAGAIYGGLVAELTSPRMAYFVTVPVVLLALVALVVFREPVLHRQQDGRGLGDQLRCTLHAMSDRATVVPAMVLGAAAGVLVQLVVEFGPLWLVDIEAPAWLYGPYTALAFGALGIGGVLAVAFGHRGRVVALSVALPLVAGTTVVAGHAVTVVAGQAVLIAGLAVVGLLAAQRLQDATPSTVRAGVVSAASTVSWLVFIPTALGFGALMDRFGVQQAGWVLVALAAGTGWQLLRRPRTSDADPGVASPVAGSPVRS
jgi:MFS family permease